MMDRRDWWILSLLFLAAAGLRFLRIGHEALWADEFYTLVTTGHASLSEMSTYLRATDPHPPLYFVTVYFARAFGESDWWLRTPSAFFSSLAVPLFYLFARLLRPARRSFGVAAATLLAVSPFSIWYAQEARPYAMLQFFEIAALAAAALATHGFNRQHAGAFRAGCWLAAAASLCAVYTHYFAAFPVALILGWLCVLAWRHRGERQNAWNLPAVAVSVSVLLALPAAWMAMRSLTTAHGISWLKETLTWQNILVDVPAAQAMGPLFQPFPAAVLVAGLFVWASLIVIGLIALRIEGSVLFYVCAAGLILTFLLPVALGTIKPLIFFGQRYLIIAVPFAILPLVSACTLGSQTSRIACSAALALLLMLQGWWLTDNYLYRHKRAWDTASEVVTEQAPPGTTVYVAPDYLAGLFARYHGDENVRAFAPDRLTEIESPMVVVCLSDIRPDMENAGIKKEDYATIFLSTHRQGQDLWLFYFSSSRTSGAK